MKWKTESWNLFKISCALQRLKITIVALTDFDMSDTAKERKFSRYLEDEEETKALRYLRENQRKIDLEYRDPKTEETFLHIAAKRGLLNVVTTLLDLGAGIEAKEKVFLDPSMISSKRPNNRMGRQLCSKPQREVLSQWLSSC